MARTLPTAVDASPTKQFFIEMLTRDIELIPAIIDLVDNCVDGARRLRPTKRYDDLFIRIVATTTKFEISDNCGGIDLDLAEKYAFRFGRPKGMERTNKSIGQFGVGMKRALFKLGTSFEVESTAETSSFLLKVDVRRWSDKSDDWSFPLSARRRTRARQESRRGTRIRVQPLHPGVASDFELNAFQSRLRVEIERAHQNSMALGLSIMLNGTPLSIDVGTLLQSADLKPAFHEFSLNGTQDPVGVRIYCGVSESKPKDAGWYVFCNGRMVLEADQTPITGWGARGGQAIPHYHNQFATFRGYVFMESNDAGRLPWNTTKTGIDTDSEVYREVKSRMLAMMRPVIDFLNNLDAEKDREDEYGPGPLTQAMRTAKAVPLTDTRPSPVFVPPIVSAKARPAGPRESSVQYKMAVRRLRVAQTRLGATSYSEVGKRTFDYFYELECE